MIDKTRMSPPDTAESQAPDAKRQPPFLRIDRREREAIARLEELGWKSFSKDQPNAENLIIFEWLGAGQPIMPADLKEKIAGNVVDPNDNSVSETREE